MSILVFCIMFTIADVVSECCIVIAKTILDIVERMMFRHKLRKRRGGNYIKRNYKYEKPYSAKL